jgi:hypothetical protein
MPFRAPVKRSLQTLLGRSRLIIGFLVLIMVALIILPPLEAWWQSTRQVTVSSTSAGSVHLKVRPAFQILPGRKVEVRWKVYGASEVYLNDTSQPHQAHQKVLIRDYCTEKQTLQVVFADGVTKVYPFTVPIIIDNILLVVGLLAVVIAAALVAGYYLPIGILSQAAHKLARLNWASIRPGNPAFAIVSFLSLYGLSYFYYVMQPDCQTRLNLYAVSDPGYWRLVLAVFLAVLVGSFSIIGAPVRPLVGMIKYLIKRWQITLLAVNVVVFSAFFSAFFLGNQSSLAVDDLYSRFFPLTEIFYLCRFASVVLLVTFLVRPRLAFRVGALLFRLPRSIMLIGVIWVAGSLSFPIVLRSLVLRESLKPYIPFLAVISLDSFMLLRGSLTGASRPTHPISRSPHRWIIQVGVVSVFLILWAGLWYGPWPGWLGDYLWPRTLAGVALFMLPGIFLQQIIYADEPWRVSRALTVGFAMSVGMTGLLGGVATIFAWPFLFVKAGLFVLGAAFFVLSIIRGSWSFQVSPIAPGGKNGTAILTMLGLIAFLAFSYLPYAMTSFYYEDYSDYRTYNAMVTNFEESDALSLNEIFLGTNNRLPSRFWLSFWPLSQAVIVNLSGLHILILFMTLSSVIVSLSLLSVYALARSLDFSRQAAWLAVIAQIFSLTFLMIGGPEARAGLWLTMRSLHDKTVAAFVLVPILLLVMNDFLTTRRKRYLLLFSLTGLALLLTHPVMLAVGSMIAGLYCLMELVVERTRIKQLIVLGIALAIAMSPAFYIRIFSPDQYSSHQKTKPTMQESIAAHGGDVPLSFQRRFNILNEGRFFGFNPELVQGTAFTLTCMGGLVALFYIRKERAARYVCAALLLIFMGLVPYTGWLIAVAIEKSQLIRLPMIIPFGISIAFLIRWVNDQGLRWVPPTKIYRRMTAGLLLPAVSIVFLVSTIDFLKAQGWLLADLHYLYYDLDTEAFVRRRDLVALGDRMEELIDQQALVLGNTDELSSQIASLSGETKTYLLFGYSANKSESFGGISREELIQRAAMFLEETSDSERIELMDTYGVKYVIIDQQAPLMRSMIATYPDLFVLDSVFGDYSLYVYKSRSG